MAVPSAGIAVFNNKPYSHILTSFSSVIEKTEAEEDESESLAEKFKTV